MKRIALAAGMLLCVAALAEDKGSPKKIEGFVVDSSNTLQPGIDLAQVWSWDAAVATPVNGIKADAKGHFEHSFKKWPGNMVVLAYDEAREKGGLIAVNEEAAKKPLTVRLGPVVKVKAKLATANALVPLPADITMRIFPVGADGELLRVKAADAGLAFRLPPGKYRLNWKGEQFHELDQEFLAGPKAELDLGEIKLEPTPIALGVGKTLPPFHALGVRGGKPDLQISDYKGKWVMVLFWGSWCNTSSTQWIPTLVKVHEHLKTLYTNYQILAYHDATAKSWAEMDEKLAKYPVLGWDPKALPFPLLLDAQDKGTVKDWGVSGEPTVLLFDPDGHFVKQGREYTVLEAELMAAAKAKK